MTGRRPIPPLQSTLRRTEKLGYAAGDAASNLYWKTFEFFLLYFYTDVFGLPAASVVTLLLVTRIWDAVNDPIFGYLADRTSTRWGRFRPYLLWGSVPLAIFGAAVFYTPELGSRGRLAYAYVTFTLAMMAYTSINTPYSALMGVISPRSDDRTSVATYRFVAAFAGAIFVQSCTLALVRRLGGGTGVDADRVGFFYTMVVYGVIAVGLFWVTFATTRERVEPAAPRPRTPAADLRFLVGDVRIWTLGLVVAMAAWWLVFKPASTHVLIAVVLAAGVLWLSGRRRSRAGLIGDSTLRQDVDDLLANGPWRALFLFGFLLLMSGFIRNGAMIFYFKYYCGRIDLLPPFLVTGSVAAIGGMLIARPLAIRLGKRNTLLGCCIVAAATMGAFGLLRADQIVVMFALQAISAVSMGPVAVLLWAMYADSADYSEWRTGRRATGLVFSAASFSQKFGGSIGAAASAGLLQWTAYAAPVGGVAQAQSDATLTGLIVMVSWLPAGLTAAAAGSLGFYRIDPAMVTRIEADLAGRRVG